MKKIDILKCVKRDLRKNLKYNSRRTELFKNPFTGHVKWQDVNDILSVYINKEQARIDKSKDKEIVF